MRLLPRWWIALMRLLPWRWIALMRLLPRWWIALMRLLPRWRIALMRPWRWMATVTIAAVCASDRRRWRQFCPRRCVCPPCAPTHTRRERRAAAVRVEPTTGGDVPLGVLLLIAREAYLCCAAGAVRLRPRY
jgi:hypothetical protein